MGLFDSIVGQVGATLSSGQSQTNNGGMMDVISHLLSDPATGGLQGLLKSFQDKGLGDIAASWVGSGPNQPITAAQIQQVIGTERLASLAQKFGLSPDTVAAGLAEILPHVIDHLSPNGQLTANHLVEQGLSILKSKLFA
jgi:uncharacterized protein YidB (DUF937 family)